MSDQPEDNQFSNAPKRSNNSVVEYDPDLKNTEPGNERNWRLLRILALSISDVKLSVSTVQEVEGLEEALQLVSAAVWKVEQAKFNEIYTPLAKTLGHDYDKAVVGQDANMTIGEALGVEGGDLSGATIVARKFRKFDIRQTVDGVVRHLKVTKEEAFELVGEDNSRSAATIKDDYYKKKEVKKPNSG